MSPLRTVALLKQVPVGDVRLGPDARVARGGQETEINPWCRRALAHAIRVGDATAITMGPPGAVDVPREAMACGAAKAIHLCDQLLAGADCLVTARALAHAVAALEGVDLVLVGHSSTDGGTGTVGPMVATVLGLPFAGPALDIEVHGRTVRATLQTDGAIEVVEVALPAVVAVAERSCKPAKADPGRWPPASTVRRWSAADAGGVRGEDSPTDVAGLRRVPRTRRRLRYVAADTADAAAAMSFLDRQYRRTPQETVPTNRNPGAGTVVVVADGTDAAGRRALLGEMAALGAGPVVYVGPPADDLARWGADQHVEPSSMEPRPVADALADRLRGTGLPWAVVGGSTSWEREVLSRLAVRLDAGLMSDLTGLEVRSGRLIGHKPAGADMLAEIVCSGPTQIATVRTGTLPLRLPRAPRPIPRHGLDVACDPAITRYKRVIDDSYDALDRADVVIGVGHGVRPDEYGLLADLRDMLGAELAATRKVTDRGWLPHSRQVGITARGIAPRLYISIGASGNLNHMAGVQRAAEIVAINSDPDAPVFDSSDIGIVGDWRAVVPALVAELRARAGVPA